MPSTGTPWQQAIGVITIKPSAFEARWLASSAPTAGRAFRRTQILNPVDSMRPGLALGHVGRLEWTVAAQHTIHLGQQLSTKGRHGAVVFSTPNMILLMERAAKEALRTFLEDDEESVGTSVNVQHLAATPIGAKVRAEATVTGITDRAIDFDVVAFDALEPIGRGTHRRAVVQLEKVRRRLEDKIAKLPDGMLLPMNLKPNPNALPPLKTLLVAATGPLLSVTLNRPEQSNSISRELTNDWCQLVAYLAGHPELRVVTLTGAGRVFCAGSDIKGLRGLDKAAATELSHQHARMWLAIEQLPQVFIAKVNGPALGGGCVVAYSCDFRIAATSATFGMPEVLLGWPPGYGLAQLTALVGKARALELCLTGKTITAGQAQAYGLCHQVVPANQLNQTVDALVKTLLATPAAALRATKQLLHLDEPTQSKVAYLNDTAAYIDCLQTADAQEGIAAFVEKRPPKFQGK
jgi:enoyl-CoA hydratase